MSEQAWTTWWSCVRSRSVYSKRSSNHERGKYVCEQSKANERPTQISAEVRVPSLIQRGSDALHKTWQPAQASQRARWHRQWILTAHPPLMHRQWMHHLWCLVRISVQTIRSDPSSLKLEPCIARTAPCGILKVRVGYWPCCGAKYVHLSFITLVRCRIHHPSSIMNRWHVRYRWCARSYGSEHATGEDRSQHDRGHSHSSIRPDHQRRCA